MKMVIVRPSYVVSRGTYCLRVSNPWFITKESVICLNMTEKLLIRLEQTNNVDKRKKMCMSATRCNLSPTITLLALCFKVHVLAIPYFGVLSFNFYLLLLQLVLCRVAALKSLPIHHP